MGRLDGLQQVLACVLKEGEGAVQVASLGLQQGLKAEGRQGTRLPVGQLGCRKAGVVVTPQGLEERVLGVAGLDEGSGMFAAMAASPTGHLHQGGEETLGGAEVGREQAGVGIHHYHQRQAVEIVSLGQHLRAHQQIGAPGMHVVQKGLGRALASCHVTVQTADMGTGEKRCQRVFQFLRAAPERGQILVAAGRARTGYGLRGGAVMADQAIARGALIAALFRFIQRKEAQGWIVPGAWRAAGGSG